MAMRPILSSMTLVALILTFLFVGCAKEEPPPPTTEAPPRPAAPPPPPPPPPAPTPPPGPSISQQAFQEFQNQDINFDFDQYDLRTDARTILDRKASFLNQNSSVRAQMKGTVTTVERTSIIWPLVSVVPMLRNRTLRPQASVRTSIYY